jgi:hypothetical protein
MRFLANNLFFHSAQKITQHRPGSKPTIVIYNACIFWGITWKNVDQKMNMLSIYFSAMNFHGKFRGKRYKKLAPGANLITGGRRRPSAKAAKCVFGRLTVDCF